MNRKAVEEETGIKVGVVMATSSAGGRAESKGQGATTTTIKGTVITIQIEDSKFVTV